MSPSRLPITQAEIDSMVARGRGWEKAAIFLPTCGLRFSDLRHLKPQHLDFDRGWIFIPAGKRKPSRLIPMPAQYRDVLRGLWPLQNGYLFPNATTLINRVALLGIECGVRDRVCVDRLRRSGVVMAFERGMDARAIQAIFGYSRTPPRPLPNSITIPWPKGKKDLEKRAEWTRKREQKLAEMAKTGTEPVPKKEAPSK